MSLNGCQINAPCVGTQLTVNGVVAPELFITGASVVGNSSDAITLCCNSGNGTIGTPFLGSGPNPASCYVQCQVSTRAQFDTLSSCLSSESNQVGCYVSGYSAAVSFRRLSLENWMGMLLGVVVTGALLC